MVCATSAAFLAQIEGICHKAQYRGDRPCKIHAVDERCSNCLSPRTGSDESCNDLCDKVRKRHDVYVRPAPLYGTSAY